MKAPVIFVSAAILANAPPLQAQEAVVDVDAFAASVRQATERYRDQSVAIGDGYRLIGPDFPGMGEHWVNVGLILRTALDATRPAILSYADIDGEPTLVGVGYAVAVAPGEPMPAFPAGPEAWHAHAGTVEDESFLPMRHGGRAGRHLAVVHAWVWLDNPDGLFARDNWALPFVRAGISHSDAIDSDAASAVALAASNRAYFSRSFVHAYPHLDRDTVEARLDEATACASQAMTQSGSIEARDVALAACWRRLQRWATDDRS